LNSCRTNALDIPQSIGRVHEPWRSCEDRIWYFSTRHKIQSSDLADHVDALERLISPFADQDGRLKELREIMERRNLEAHATLFWRGPAEAPRPSIPSAATAALRRLPADIEPDFANEDC